MVLCCVSTPGPLAVCIGFAVPGDLLELYAALGTRALVSSSDDREKEADTL